VLTADGLALPVDEAPAVVEGALELDDARVLQVPLRAELVRRVLRDRTRPGTDRRAVAHDRRDLDPGGDDLPNGVVVAGEELVTALGAGHPGGPVAGGPAVHRRDVQLDGDRVALALQVAGLDLAESRERHRLEPERCGERRGGDLRADHRRDEQPLDAAVGQRCRQGVGLPLAELGQPRSGDDGVEDAVHVRGGLAVADEEQSHAVSLRNAYDVVAGRAARVGRTRAADSVRLRGRRTTSRMSLVPGRNLPPARGTTSSLSYDVEDVVPSPPAVRGPAVRRARRAVRGPSPRPSPVR
jgi:hypothetical protein